MFVDFIVTVLWKHCMFLIQSIKHSTYQQIQQALNTGRRYLIWMRNLRWISFSLNLSAFCFLNSIFLSHFIITSSDIRDTWKIPSSLRSRLEKPPLISSWSPITRTWPRMPLTSYVTASVPHFLKHAVTVPLLWTHYLVHYARIMSSLLL